jgi:ankyrin repeat protein
MKTHSTSVQFTNRFFQLPAHVFLQEAEGGVDDITSSISYTPEKYGTWEAFNQHKDYALAEAQYEQIFIAIHQFIEAHYSHPASLHQAFSTFLTRLSDGTFIPRLPFLFGEGKRVFEAFQALILNEKIPLENRITAVQNLSDELYVCADGAINSLIAIVRQLQCAMGGNLGEALRIKEQAIEQLIREFNADKVNNPGMEKHYIAVYQNFLRARYGLPSLENDIHAHQASLGITDADLQACAAYVEARLTPERIASIMAETYLNEVYSVIPSEGTGLSYEEASERLTALKSKLTPIYGDVPDTTLLREINGQYYATGRDTLIKVALMQTLQQSEAFAPQDTLYYQYKTPDTTRSIRQFDATSQQFVIREQTLRGETIGIHHSRTVWWAHIVEENTPTLLTLSHLKPFSTEEATIPPVSLLETEALFTEALINSSAEEITQSVPIWRNHMAFLQSYIKFIVKREAQTEKILVDLFVENDLRSENRQRPLLAVLQQLGLTALTDKDMQYLNHPNARKFLSILLNLGVDWNIYKDRYNSENFTLNYITLNGYYLGPPLTEIFKVLSPPDTPLVIKAAQRGWLKVIQLLSSFTQPKINLDERNTVGQTALMLAAENGHNDIIAALCFAGADIALVSPGKGTALSHAVSAGKRASVNYLLNLRAIGKSILNFMQLRIDLWYKGLPTNFPFDLEATDTQFGKTALMWLFTSDISAETTQKILALLLNDGANVNTRTKLNEALIDQPTVFSRGCFEQLLAAGLDIYDPDNAAHVMARTLELGTTAQVEKLIQLNLPVYIPTREGLSFIESDIVNRRFDVALRRLSYCQKALTHHSRAAILHTISELLLDHTLLPEDMPQIKQILQMTLDPALLSQADKTAQHFFAEFLRYQSMTQEEVVTTRALKRLIGQMMLLNDYTNLDFPIPGKKTALLYLLEHVSEYQSTMALESLLAMIRFLAQHTDQLTQPDHDGFTPFLLAAQMGNLPILQILFSQKPALLNSRDPEGNTPLLLATNGGQLDIMDWLLAQEAEINARNHAGYTALMFAYMRNHQPGIQMLLATGANRHITRQGMTAEMLAAQFDHPVHEYSMG